MPISRYEIRNEYSLADPELYRAADKDDPEALLEGVAMAGLVGVLRQLGDLAEFAAEIFHNLHEEVMATAARGHGIMVRVQQLETEIPSIEKAFLSQTDHSSFFYHAGVDWHPNLQLDHNLITQGDLPRFIMDSYEECRAPPRLFLLDKFDVAGAGACLKRYTDPSFFKVETSEIISADVQREKKIRKIKKKGPRLKNGETPEVLPTTHTKLHQLFLEERVETGVGKPSFRAKLKRRLNGFPFDSKTGKSYMEKLLKSPSPDHEVLHEVAMTSSPLLTATNDNKESSFEVFEIRRFSPDRASWGRTRSPPSSPDEEENMLNPSTYEPNKSSIDDKLWEVPDSCSSIATNGISSTIDNVTRKKLGAVYGEGDKEERLTGYQSDDIASEIDNFVDAPSNMESEMDGDSELRVKSDISSSHTKNESLISNAYEENLHTRLSDSSSPGDSTISDDGNNSSTKEMSNSSSESSSTSVANSQGENTSAKGFQYNDVPANELVDASSYNKTADEDFDVDHSTPVVSDDTCTETDAITNHRSELEQLTYLLHPDSEEVVMESILKAPESDEIVTTLDDEEKKANLVIDPPRSPSLCGFESQSEDDSTGSSAGERQVYGPNSEGLSSLSTEPDVYCHTADSSGETSLDSLHEDESDVKDCGLVDDVASTSNVLHNSTNGTPEAISSENPIPDRVQFPEVPENSPSSYTVAEHYGDNIDSAVSNGDNLSSVLDDEDSSGATESPDHFPREASLEKRLEGTSLANAETVNVEDNFASSSIENQISSDNFRLSQQADSPDRATEGLDVHTGVVIPEEDATRDETLSLETSKPCEVAGSQDIGITHHVFPNDPESLESSCYNPEDHEEPAGKADSVDMSSSREEVTEISGSADLESVNEIHVLLDKSDSEADKSNSSAVPAVSDNRDLYKLVEEHHTCFEESGVDENDVNHPSECHGESDVVERAGPTEASASCFETVFSNAVNNNHPESESSSIARNSHLDIEVDDNGPEFVHASTTNSPSEQCGVDREQELFNHSGLQNHTPDAHSLLVDNDIEESRAQEKSELPLSQLDQESLHPGETSSVFSFPLPVNNQQMIDHDDDFKQDDDPPFFSELPRPSNREIDVPGYPKDPLSSIFSPINPFSDTNQINLSDIAPLPPLPPAQWRMGKLQHASSSTDGEMERHNELSAQLVSPQTVPSDIVSSPPPPTSTGVVGSSTLTTSTNDINFSPEEVKHPPIEIPLETASKESINNSSSSLEANTLVENKQQDIVKTTTETVSTPPAEEDGTENESRTAKLPRLRNPLVDDVSVLDKSKLRKVSERVRPEIEKVDERDSLLEQIRTKSFNLKPAMASRPSIRGPNTNLKVAAILEKANAIRQAFAGSDEDDSDSWSDS